MPSILRRGLLPSLALALAALGAAVPVAASYADEASDAPVTAPDSVTIAAGHDAAVRVLANDTDPNGDYLVLCRTDPAVKGQPQAEIDPVDQSAEQAGPAPHGADRLEVDTTGVAPGTYTVTYHACDFDYVSAGTVTVTVTPSHDVRATKVAGRVGTVRFTNPASVAVEIDYYTVTKHQTTAPASHTILVGPHHSRRVHVTGQELVYDAHHGGRSYGGGRVLGLRSSGDQHAAAPEPSSRAGVRPSDTPTDQAPITADDTVTIHQDDFDLADVLADDSDPDGTQADLQICRVAVPPGSQLEVSIVSPSEGFYVASSGPGRSAGPAERRAAVRTVSRASGSQAPSRSTSELELSSFGSIGTFTVTYWACDEERLTPATVTVHVVHSTELRIDQVGPHAYRFLNPGSATYHVRYGRTPRHLDHHFLLRPGASRRVRESGTDFAYDATSRHSEYSGHYNANGESSSSSGDGDGWIISGSTTSGRATSAPARRAGEAEQAVA